ncbi:MAG TPA: DUF2939 domain-containing protein [Microvirga sp.]|jgi:hypothetical protein|nr:DUF2939 domain-containing protein [Microvirga sp.]
MRWAFRFGILLLLGWLLFLASPFLAVYSLARAVETRDVAAIEGRVNFVALRGSLVQQVIDAYLKSGSGQELDPARRRLAASAGASLADPIVARLATPQALLDLFEDGWPEAVAGLKPADDASGGLAMDWVSVRQAGRLFAGAETRGFRKIYISLPVDRPQEERFRLYLRLKGTTWRLMGVDLPLSLRQRLVKDLPRPNA